MIIKRFRQFSLRGKALAITAILLAGSGVLLGAARFARRGPNLPTIEVRRGEFLDSLQFRGPYRWVRHPLYLGWLLATFGPAHMTGDRLVFAAISLFYLVIAVPFEERSLIDTFGEPYRRYRELVRWRIVPYVY